MTVGQAVPGRGTVRSVARPRGTIPAKQWAELVAAQADRAKAEAAAEDAERRFKHAIQAAIRAGGSYAVVAEVAQVAKSTVQKYAALSSSHGNPVTRVDENRRDQPTIVVAEPWDGPMQHHNHAKSSSQQGRSARNTP